MARKQHVTAWRTALWLRRMGKRKVDSFTVNEVVSSWIEPNRDSGALTGAPSGNATAASEGVNHQLGLPGGQSTGGVANATTVNPYLEVPATSHPVNRDGESSQLKLTSVLPAGEAANGTGTTLEGTELAEAEGPGGWDEVARSDHVASDDLTELAAAAHQAFWDLLTRAGYEEL